MGKTNKTPEFLKLNPWGKVPTLETDSGEGIWESNAIARYVARQTQNDLFGTNALEAGQVEQWIDWVRGDLEIAGAVWLYPIYGVFPNRPEATERAKQDIKTLLGVLNNYLADRSYLVGERVTLADIVVACTLVPLYTKVFDENYRKGFPNVTRWFVNMVSQPNFLKVQNEVVLCTKMEEAQDSASEKKQESVEQEPAVEEQQQLNAEQADEQPEQVEQAVEQDSTAAQPEEQQSNEEPVQAVCTFYFSVNCESIY